MSKLILTDAGIYVGALDLTGDSNEGSLELTRDIPEVTNFDSGGYKERLPGMMDFSLSMSMYFDNADAKTSDLFSKVGLNGEPFIIVPTKTAGEVAYLGDSPAGEYVPMEGGVGDPLRSRLSLQGGGANAKEVSRGQLDPVKTTDTGAGQSAGVNLGNVSATQELVAVLILTAFTGTDITFLVQKDTTGFPSPLTAITMTTQTAIGGVFGSVAGAITPEDFFRFSWSGTFTSATFVGAIAVREA